MWRTKKDFEKSLKDSYKRFGLPVQKLGLGAELREFRRLHDPKGVPVAERGLAVLDVLVTDAILWCFLFSMVFFRERATVSDKSLRQALWSLSNLIVQDSIVIRDLINSGFDLQARNLLRSLDEHLDVIYYICIHP